MYGSDNAYYERAGRWASTPRHRAELEALVAAMALAPGDYVLDLGCGTGSAMRYLSERGVARIGIDRSPFWPRFCTERPVALADAARLPFPDRRFDGVLLMHVLAHFVDPGQSLREIVRVLKPGGRLGIVTPNRHFVAAHALIPRWWNRYVSDATVERHFSVSEVERLVLGAGLRVERAHTHGRAPRVLPFAGLRERALIVATHLPISSGLSTRYPPARSLAARRLPSGLQASVKTADGKP